MGYPNHPYISGQIAVKFELTTPDSIRGIRVSFAKMNQAFDDISFHIYTDGNGVPSSPITHPAVPLFGRRL